MVRVTRSLVVVAVWVLVALVPAAAEMPPTGNHGGSIGVGFQGSFPAYGASAIANVGEQFAIQGVVGAIGDLHSFFARGVYRFSPKRRGWGWQNLYAFGMIGAFSYPWFVEDISSPDFGKETRESAPGFGAGFGIEGFLESAPDIGWTLEVGLGSVSFDKANFDFSAIEIGAGLHYYFGGK